jgi:GT2 family glycosyltransferase
MQPLVYVLIVNYNGRHWLQDCLQSLYAAKYDNFAVLLIDNNSADGSVEFVKSNFSQTKIIVNESNLGFCEGNNIGIIEAFQAQAQYVVLLNNDTKVTENWLTELVTVGENNSEIGVLGAVQTTYSGTEFNSWTNTVAKEHLAELSKPETARQWIPMRWVEGSCFAIKRHIIEEIGMLDPIYFMYYEEIDYCRRVSAHGYQIALVPRCRIHHFRGGTSKADQKAKRIRATRYDRSHLIYHATELRRSFATNFCYYLLVFGHECFLRIKRGRFDRIWDLISLQPKILKSFDSIRRKWKSDRTRLKTRQKFQPLN